MHKNIRRDRTALMWNIGAGYLVWRSRLLVSVGLGQMSCETVTDDE
ncbi:hypothetical protein [Phormidium sp. CCY1219]|nr:hypothetical protein [Phormidium sp. CCY1219]MEB3830352.1 hypothetical protein [Phormidium sp. CCY1219]